MERRCYGVFLVFLLKLILGKCDESSEEATEGVLGEEYDQIFYNIPTLFEYLLEILEERPEILERDDVTFFQQTLTDTCEGDDRRKKEVEKCDDNLFNDENNLKKRHVTDDFGNEKHTDNVDQRLVDFPTTDIPDFITTYIPDIIPTERIDLNVNNNAATIDKLQSKKNPKASKNDEKKKGKTKSKTNKNRSKDSKKDKKRNVNIDEKFLGSINWSLFQLSPEEVEEQAIKTEQAIEEHNKKRAS